jgi:hypothetical protein
LYAWVASPARISKNPIIRRVYGALSSGEVCGAAAAQWYGQVFLWLDWQDTLL